MAGLTDGHAHFQMPHGGMVTGNVWGCGPLGPLHMPNRDAMPCSACQIGPTVSFPQGCPSVLSTSAGASASCPVAKLLGPGPERWQGTRRSESALLASTDAPTGPRRRTRRTAAAGAAGLPRPPPSRARPGAEPPAGARRRARAATGARRRAPQTRRPETERQTDGRIDSRARR
jgi:hypothetical protein